MSTPEDRRAAWIALMSALEAQLTATRENARAMARRSLDAWDDPEAQAKAPEWNATAWAASQLLRDLRVIPAPIVPRDDVTGQATLDDLVTQEPEATIGGHVMACHNQRDSLDWECSCPSSTPGDELVEGVALRLPLQCPECLNGKHPNCDGVAYDDILDDTTPCECSCLDSREDHRPVIDNDGDTWTRQADGTWKGTWGPSQRPHGITMESRQAVVEAFGERDA